ncbi:MAG: vWA domain-containing protein [Myxococcota bacterium]
MGCKNTKGGAAALFAMALACMVGACTVGEGELGFETNEGVPTTTASPTTGDSSTGSDSLDTGGGGFPDLGMADDGIGTACADVTATIEPVIPTIVLLVDRSGSMNDDFGGISRWQAVADALFDPAGGVVAQLESTIRFGMALYTSDNGMFGGACPMLDEVAPSLDNLAAMDAAFTQPLAEGDTPTGEALAAVATSLAAEPDTARAIVLATDGEPDTCAVPDPQNGQPESVTAVVDAYAEGIKTFVISVGGEVSAGHLQELANVGVGKAANDPDPAPYFEALDTAQLIAAFDQIVGGFVSCEFAIDGIVDLEAACQGTVLLDGVELECESDWHVPEESTLELLGAACDTLQDGGEHDVLASFPCMVISPIP